ncbi:MULTISPECIES: hypothetical protein [Pontibacillus]|uniref:Uncharacterized protein n=1 Tax=Pontibacillus chungwhensis TaxID=265426 RepID=A0ABY8V3R0_9BACI|nr:MULTISPECIES: hypothetical protein [Pontibacillus]MCD5322357.1 hypothetical protein [Pontibacillus sp. HN14]WIF99646.1 hypothetical protein QNI29_08310 [Pontibacillus chungwhensis]
MRVPVIPVLLFLIYVSLLGNHIFQSFVFHEAEAQVEQQLFPYLWDEGNLMEYKEPGEGSFFIFL